MSTERAWGDLSAADAGQPVAVHFWWDDTPTTATFVRTMGVFSFSPDGVPNVRHVLDYGGEVGQQETQLPADSPVITGAGDAQPEQLPPPPPPPGIDPDPAPEAPQEPANPPQPAP